MLMTGAATAGLIGVFRVRVHICVMAHQSVGRALYNAIRGRCPKCGVGRLFKSYLKPVDSCGVCGEPLRHIRADDGPAWLTILTVGHLAGGALLYVEQTFVLPAALVMGGFVALALGAALAFLPRAKGAFIGVLWATGAPGSERPDS